jgi:hypothetical protein
VITATVRDAACVLLVFITMGFLILVTRLIESPRQTAPVAPDVVDSTDDDSDQEWQTPGLIAAHHRAKDTANK